MRMFRSQFIKLGMCFVAVLVVMRFCNTLITRGYNIIYLQVERTGGLFNFYDTADKVDQWQRQTACGSKLHNYTENTLNFSMIMRDIEPPRLNANVFLIDSGCDSHPKYRAWCAVESWAYHNPGLDVWFLQTAPTIDDLDGLPSHLLQHYPNINIAGIDLANMTEGTPIKPLFRSERWLDKHTWPINQLSDMARMLVLWHWGGTYSDTDIVCLKNYTVPFNALGLQDQGSVNGALLTFTHHHPVVWKIMEDMNKNFIPGVWGSIGPGSMTRVMSKECSSLLMEEAPHHCHHNVTVYPPASFYPIPYRQHKKYLDRNGGKDMKQKFAKSYILHLWNKFTKSQPVRVGDNTIYEEAAKTFCPITYRQATLRSGFF